MTNQEFYSQVKENILSHLPDNLKNVNAELVTVTKHNDTKQVGLKLIQEGEKASPLLYLEPYFERYENGESMESLMNDISEAYQHTRETTISTPEMDYDKIKDRLAVQLVSIDHNKERLKDLLYKPLGNGFAFTYSIIQNVISGNDARLYITRAMATNHHYDLQSLSVDALEATAKRSPAVFADMESIMEEMTGEREKDSLPELSDDLSFGDNTEPMFVLSNPERVHGATCLYYPEAQEQIARAIGDSFYVLPSSVHEQIIVPEGKALSPEDLKQMVKEVNDSQLSPDELLSYDVLHYDKNSKELTIAGAKEKSLGTKDMEVR
ncbi:DUF5688 family protein [Ohessyouella blattaphilus]|uniref:DUF5688 family protein n=1 Tax=Ohessyouella blattaphilus TaxID=2949333 RepID=A0ABT1EJM1_9FIRM|nr:DUF5688 family protein [Ohessyouella blattaphilus]MCP1110898.1 DUF5688 family protein [Ohessyouella blattaphilus]MCR8564292.1 DUF5688 family protein [Ohessyouella blattaphilus]